MQITRTKKALIAVIALVLIGVFAAVAAVYLPGSESSLPFKDNTVADSGSGADTVSTVSASATAPLEDGQVATKLSESEAKAQGYTVIDGTEGNDFSVVRNNPSGKYILMDNITVTEPSQVTFNGELNGNGYAIEIDFGGDERKESPWGGLFGSMSGGAISNLTVNVKRFNYRTQSGSTRNVGVLLGTASGGTVSNVCVNLNYEGTGVDSYFADPAAHSSGTIYLNFGVIAGYVSNININNVTINNNKGLTTYTQAGGDFLNRPTFENSVATFIGKVGDNGTVNITDCTLAGTGIRNVQHVKGSHGTHKKYSGGVIGNIENGTVNVTRFDMEWLANWDTVTGSNLDGNDGLFYGATGNSGTINIVDLYYNSNSVQTWVAGDSENWNAYIAYDPAAISISFDKANPGNVIFATQFAEIDSSDLLYSINTGSTETKVYSVLAADGTEKVAGSTAYVSVPASGYNTSATGSFTLKKMTVGAEATISYDYDAEQSAYTATKVYDAQNIFAPTVTVNGVEVAGAWSGDGLNVGTYDFTLLEADATVGDYQLIVRGDKYVFVDETTGISHNLSYQSKVLKYTVTPADLQLTFEKVENSDIIYKDSADSINKYFQVSVVNGVLYGNIDAWDIASAMVGEVAYDATTAAGSVVTVTVDEDSIVLSDGKDNYNITWQNGSAQSTVQKLILSGGTFSGLENLVYNTQSQKTAVFTVSGIEAAGISYKYTVKGETEESEVINAGTYTVTATAVDPSVELTDNVNDFVVSPYTVTITVNEEATTEYEYSGVVPNEVLLSLFNAPEGLAGETLFLDFKAKINDADATVQYAGTYTVTATLAKSYVGEDGETVSQANYTAAACEATITIKAKEINVSLSDVENSKTYDGVVVGNDYLQTMFVVDGTVAEGHVSELEITVAEGEIKNAGVYNISVELPSYYDTMYAISSDSTTSATYTVEQATVDGEIIAPEDSVYDGSEKFATFEFAEGYGMFGDDEVILSYATQGGQSVTQVVSAGTYTVSAALPEYAAGKSNYKWANNEIATKDIVIEKAPVTIGVVSDTAGKTYDKTAFDNYASLFTAPKAVDGITDLTLSYSVSGAAENILNAGAYTVTATLDDNAVNANYKANEAVVTYTISAADLTAVSVTGYSGTYDKETHGAVVNASATTVDGSDVTFTYATSEDGDYSAVAPEYTYAGNYTVYYKATAANHNETSGNFTVDIAKADSVINTDGVVKTYTYTGALQTVNSGATLNHSEAELTYSNNTFTTVAEGNGMDIYVSVEESENYYGASTVFTITVNKATPVFTVIVEPTEGLFTSSEMPAISADFGENTVVAGTIAWDDQTLTAGEKAYGWTFTPEDTANYNVVKDSETLTVSAVELTGIEVVAQPSRVNYEYGDKFDNTGMVVEAVYNDGARVAVDGYTFTDEYLTTLGENQIEISYNGKTATVAVNVEAKEFEIAYSDLTVVAGTADFDLASITASIVGTENNTVSLAGVDYTYSVAIDYADAQYDQSAEVGTEYPLTVTVTVTDLEAQNYVDTYTATLKVIATPMTGSWASDSVTAEYDGNAHAAVFTSDNGLTEGVDFEIQYAVKGSDVWTTDVPVNAGEYVAKVVSKNNGYSADRIPTATVTISKKEVSVNWTGSNRVVFSGAVYEPAFEATGLIGEDKISVTYEASVGALTDGKARNAGSYTATVTLPSNNYAFASDVQQSFAFKITKVTISVELKDNTVTVEYGDGYAWDLNDFYGNVETTNSELLEAYLAWSMQSDLTGIETANAGTKYEAAVELRIRYKDGEDLGIEDVDNFELVTEVDYIVVYVEVVPKKLTVEWGSTSLTYNGKAQAPTATVDTGIAGEEITLVVNGAETNVGTGYEATATTDNGNYTLENATTSFTIDKLKLEKPVAASGLVYDGTEQTGVADGDYYTVTGGKATNADNYTATVSLKDTVNTAWEDDTVDDVEVAWSIAKATPTVNPVVPEMVFRYTKLIEISIELSEGDTPGTIEWKNPSDVIVEGENVCEWIFTPTDTDNYNTLEDSVTLIGEYVIVTHIEILQTPDKLVYEYGDEPDITGLKARTVYNNGATSTIDNSKLTVSPNVLTELGKVTVTIKYFSYTTTFDVTVNKKEISVNWTGENSVVYSGTAYEPTFEATALAGDDVIGVTYEATEGALTDGKAINAGSYKVTLSLPSENYVFAEGAEISFDFTIEKADYDMSGVTFADKTVTYNGAVQKLTVTGTLPDGVTVTYSSNGIENAGSVKITATFETSDANYNAPEAMIATLTVAPKQLTFTGYKAVSREYTGDKTITLTGGSLTGIITGDSVTYSYRGEMNTANAGENTVTVTVELTGADAGNYTVATPATTKVTITPATLTVEWSNTQLTYNGREQAPTATVVKGLVGSDSVTLSVTGGQTNAGTSYTATATTDNGNYTIGNATTSFTIAKATYVMTGVTFEDKTTTYNGAVQGITVTGTLPDGVTVSYSAGGTNVGEYDVTATFTGDEVNYNAIPDMTAKLTITAKTVTVEWSNTKLTYNGKAQLPTATVDTGIDGETLTLTVSADKEAVQPGDYTATATTDNGNYALENATVGFTIVRSEVAAQFTVESYGEITVKVEDLGDGVEYSVDGGAWTALPADGKITVTPAASWTVSLRFKGETNVVNHVVYTSAGNVVTYLENNLSDNAIDNKAVIDTAKTWLETAVGDKSEATAKIEAAEQAYEAAKDELAESVENAFKATANMTSRAVAATVAIATAVTGLGLAVGALALRRKGGKKNEK